ncbi:MAG TPA: heme exporter protein CcmB [Spirochaetota bacterium]|nr:heme exporter protein CcmB [Spirochaetota bacterium]HQP47703.1 heme exporter protein CcmB [Spirochaetota bacterium]
MVKTIIAHIKKDFRIEFRNRYAVSVSFSFAFTTTLAISLAAGGIPFSPQTHAVILWVIMFFTAMSGLAHIFVREEDRGTSLFLRLNSPALAVFTAKLLYNVLLFFVLQCMILPVYLFFMQLDVQSPLFFLGYVFLGGIALSSSLTILAAIVARAGARGALFPVISLPVSLPVLWVVIQGTSRSLGRAGFSSPGDMVFLLAFSGTITAVSYLLFEFVWHD